MTLLCYLRTTLTIAHVMHMYAYNHAHVYITCTHVHSTGQPDIKYTKLITTCKQ